MHLNNSLSLNRLHELLWVWLSFIITWITFLISRVLNQNSLWLLRDERILFDLILSIWIFALNTRSFHSCWKKGLNYWLIVIYCRFISRYSLYFEWCFWRERLVNKRGNLIWVLFRSNIWNKIVEIFLNFGWLFWFSRSLFR